MRAAIVKNDVVVNVIKVHDLSFEVEPDCELIEAPAGEIEIGYIREGDTFIEPEEE